MSSVIEVKVPDIGDFKDIPVIEVLVKAGERVEKESALITLESDKATMEVPSTIAGVVRELKVKVGDSLSEGSVVALIEAAGAGSQGAGPAAETPKSSAQESRPAAPEAAKPAPPAPVQPAADVVSAGVVQETRVPDIGDYTDVPVIGFIAIE